VEPRQVFRLWLVARLAVPPGRLPHRPPNPGFCVDGTIDALVPGLPAACFLTNLPGPWTRKGPPWPRASGSPGENRGCLRDPIGRTRAPLVAAPLDHSGRSNRAGGGFWCPGANFRPTIPGRRRSSRVWGHRTHLLGRWACPKALAGPHGWPAGPLSPTQTRKGGAGKGAPWPGRFPSAKGRIPDPAARAPAGPRIEQRGLPSIGRPRMPGQDCEQHPPRWAVAGFGFVGGPTN